MTTAKNSDGFIFDFGSSANQTTKGCLQTTSSSTTEGNGAPCSTVDLGNSHAPSPPTQSLSLTTPSPSTSSPVGSSTLSQKVFVMIVFIVGLTSCVAAFVMWMRNRMYYITLFFNHYSLGSAQESHQGGRYNVVG